MAELAPEGAANAASGAAAILVGATFLFSMAGQYFGGHVADRIDLRRVYLIFLLAGLPFVSGMFLLSGAPLFIAAAGFAFFSLGIQPVENSLVSRLMPRKWLSTGYGIKTGIKNARRKNTSAVKLIITSKDSASRLCPIASFR